MAKSREAFRTISEVADWLDVQTHVLRFWESKFSQVKPVKRAGGRRYYRPQDMELLGGIKKLLHEDGMPIKDAQKLIREMGVKHVSSLSQPIDEPSKSPAKAEIEATPEPVATETKVAPSPEMAFTPSETTEAPAFEPQEELEETPLPEASETEVTGTDEQEISQDEIAAPVASGADDLETPPLFEPEELPDRVAAGTADAEMSFEPTPSASDDAPASAPAANNTIGSADTATIGDLFASLDAASAEQELDSVLETETPEPATDSSTPTDVEADFTVEDTLETSPTDMPEPAFKSEVSEAPETTAPAASSPEQAAPFAADTAQAVDASAENEPFAPEQTAPATPEDMPSVDAVQPASAEEGQPVEAETTGMTIEQEESQDAFLSVFTKQVRVAPENQSRAAELLARLEALHAKAS
ncbi:MerR family transcriptional regulator [Shimia sp. R9_3]|uniref:MerR family transcriptional regulator n=1 Tax=Shimia sp. R9_3 TaxID=2821113 RepID=UPI001AD9E6D0|nr:MerR family transcriptional regulator [Shimia sp. R9_3]MBO9401947.1 MerR family transcriptional regulator [Shimia sp. R9_3]